MNRFAHPVLVVAACLSSMAVTAFAQTQPRPGSAAASPAPQAPQDQASAQLAEALPMLDDKARRALALQVALDRAGFSPGEIDGAPGSNTDRALAAYKAARGTAEPAVTSTSPVVTYTISPEDAATPTVPAIPADMMEKSKLPSLAYTSLLEMLSERFHASPKLLQRLNPKAQFVAGEQILVPNVEPFLAPASAGTAPADGSAAAASGRTPANRSGEAPRTSGPASAKEKGLTVTVTDRTKTLEVRNAAGDVIFHAPVTTGSENDPLPIGEWKINGVGRNPTFNYNPKLFWDADPSHAKAKIPAGPNNPVGVVWIDISKEHYGLHGTPEPGRIGYTESHGCVRLTNWDAMRVAELVSPGTKVIFK